MLLSELRYHNPLWSGAWVSSSSATVTDWIADTLRKLLISLVSLGVSPLSLGKYVRQSLSQSRVRSFLGHISPGWKMSARPVTARLPSVDRGTDGRGRIIADEVIV